MKQKIKEMVKKRTLDEYRQEKPYGYNPPTKEKPIENNSWKSDDPLDEVKNEIVEKLTRDLHDIFFEHVCEEMNKYHIFDMENYIIDIDDPTLPDELQDAWFEYYHGVHGDILGRLMRNITN